MSKLPPRVVGKKLKKSETAKKNRDSGDESHEPVERTQAARSIGIGMMVFGAIAMVLPLFGMQLRRLGDNGHLTPIVGVVMLVIGAISFIVSLTKTSTNLAALGVKIILWGFLGLMVLILIAGVAALIFMR